MSSSLLKANWRVVLMAVLVGAGASGCATMYIDNSLGDTSAGAYHRPAAPKPVQVLFSFKTKGTENVRATTTLRQDAMTTVQQSGLFTDIGPDPVPGGALLSITIDNVPITSQQDALAKGFAAGLTLGLAGSEVTDGYVCTVEFISAGQANKISVIEHHAIHTTIGAHGAPANATRAPNAATAVKTMIHRIIAAGLKDLSLDPAFGS